MKKGERKITHRKSTRARSLHFPAENDIFLVILTTREALDDNTAQTSEKYILYRGNQ